VIFEFRVLIFDLLNSGGVGLLKEKLTQTRKSKIANLKSEME
jgi:hypothetical protein